MPQIWQATARLSPYILFCPRSDTNVKAILALENFLAGPARIPLDISSYDDDSYDSE